MFTVLNFSYCKTVFNNKYSNFYELSFTNNSYQSIEYILSQKLYNQLSILYFKLYDIYTPIIATTL